MKVFIVGDTHHDLDLEKINRENLARLKISNDDILVHLGDIGVPYFGQENDAIYDYYRSLPFDIIVNLGNHENYPWILKQPIIEKYSAKGYRLAENIFAPLIGEIANISSTKLWFYPGGYSIDYFYRRWGESVFAEELPTKKASDAAIEKLINSGGVDVIISHDGPREFIVSQFGYPIQPQSRHYSDLSGSAETRVHPAFALDEIYLNHPDLYQRWYFGHHHKDYCHGKLCCLFNKIEVLELGENSA